MRLGIFRSFNDCGLARFLTQTIGDILLNGARKKEDILLNGRNLRTQRIQAPLAHINTIDKDASLINIIDTIDQFRERTFARASLPNNSDRLTRFGMEGDVFEHGSAAITKRYMLEHDVA